MLKSINALCPYEILQFFFSFCLGVGVREVPNDRLHPEERLVYGE